MARILQTRWPQILTYCLTPHPCPLSPASGPGQAPQPAPRLTLGPAPARSRAARACPGTASSSCSWRRRRRGLGREGRKPQPQASELCGWKKLRALRHPRPGNRARGTQKPRPPRVPGTEVPETHLPVAARGRRCGGRLSRSASSGAAGRPPGRDDDTLDHPPYGTWKPSGVPASCVFSMLSRETACTSLAAHPACSPQSRPGLGQALTQPECCARASAGVVGWSVSWLWAPLPVCAPV